MVEHPPYCWPVVKFAASPIPAACGKGISFRYSLLRQKITLKFLFACYYRCARGKRRSRSFQEFLFRAPQKIRLIFQEISQTHNYRWHPYREFIVHDPKTRTIMAAPFGDRIVHTALHTILESYIEPYLSVHTYACRKGKGNRMAVQRLRKQLQVMGPRRYAIKLDVKSYFASIDHGLLYRFVMGVLPDQSLGPILQSLLHSHPQQRAMGRGIPIGNLTSQLFANFYLARVDLAACAALGISYLDDKIVAQAGYIRYMDDLLILAATKAQALAAAAQVRTAANALKLSIPREKFIALGADPIPFLGFVISDNSYRPLRRNERRFVRQVKQVAAMPQLVYLHELRTSFNAWKDLDHGSGVWVKNLQNPICAKRLTHDFWPGRLA